MDARPTDSRISGLAAAAAALAGEEKRWWPALGSCVSAGNRSIRLPLATDTYARVERWSEYNSAATTRSVALPGGAPKTGPQGEASARFGPNELFATNTVEGIRANKGRNILLSWPQAHVRLLVSVIVILSAQPVLFSLAKLAPSETTTKLSSLNRVISSNSGNNSNKYSSMARAGESRSNSSRSTSILGPKLEPLHDFGSESGGVLPRGSNEDKSHDGPNSLDTDSYHDDVNQSTYRSNSSQARGLATDSLVGDRMAASARPKRMPHSSKCNASKSRHLHRFCADQAEKWGPLRPIDPVEPAWALGAAVGRGSSPLVRRQFGAASLATPRWRQNRATSTWAGAAGGGPLLATSNWRTEFGPVGVDSLGGDQMSGALSDAGSAKSDLANNANVESKQEERVDRGAQIGGIQTGPPDERAGQELEAQRVAGQQDQVASESFGQFGEEDEQLFLVKGSLVSEPEQEFARLESRIGQDRARRSGSKLSLSEESLETIYFGGFFPWLTDEDAKLATSSQPNSASSSPNGAKASDREREDQSKGHQGESAPSSQGLAAGAAHSPESRHQLGRFILPAVRLALDHINSNTSVLGSYKLEIVPRDTKVSWRADWFYLAGKMLAKVWS